MSLSDFDLPLDELERYRPERDEPGDFDAFWAATLADAERHPLDVRLTAVEPRLTTVEAFDVSFRGFGGDPVSGWLVRPRDVAEPHPCVVEFLGYHAGRGSVYDHLGWASAGYVNLVVETRGQGGPGQAGVTPDPHSADPHVPGRMTNGIRSPESYVYRRIFTDAARAVGAAAAQREVDAARIAVAGRSQGGGIALAAGALADVAAVVADVPFLCHFARAIRLTDEEPFSEIATYLRIYRSEVDAVLRTLSYFDGINFAARGTAPALFAVALMDRVCPPSTVFAAYNHYGGPREINVWPFNGHESGEEDQLHAAQRFLDRVLA